MPPLHHCRVGSRDSKLAVIQAHLVIKALQDRYPQTTFELITCKTLGDCQLEKRFEEIGTTGLFVKELEMALLANQIDIAVHSLKDMPSMIPDGLKLTPVFTRDDCRDALISKENMLLKDLPAGAIVGTASARRQAQIHRLRPDLLCKPIRGNVQTRLRKMTDEHYDAIILAAAGLERLNQLEALATQCFDPITDCIPSPNQGILAIETRTDHVELADYIDHLTNPTTVFIAQAERALIQATGSGCHTPLGGFAQLNPFNPSQLDVVGILFSTENPSVWVETKQSGALTEAQNLGEQVGKTLLNKLDQAFV